MRTRREVVQGLILSMGGAAMLSACGGEATLVATESDSGQWRFLSQREMDLITRLSDLIIPRTDTPGAVDAKVPGYIDGLMADWANEATQQGQRQALALIDQQLNELAGGDFIAVDMQQAETILRDYDAKAFTGGQEYGGYRNLKSAISSCYFVSEEGAVQELKWVPAPGRWDPAVPVESLS